MMAKKHQQRSAREHIGRNYPEKSTAISAGGYKRSETAHAQAMRGENPGAQPPMSSVPPAQRPRPYVTHKADSHLQTIEHAPSSQTRANEPRGHPPSRAAEFAHDLEVGQRPAGGMGTGSAAATGGGPSAFEAKRLHTKLADLTDDELKNVPLVPTGTRLVEGAQYIDLNHLERGAFVADSRMISGPEDVYVAKKAVDYVLWNRLNQVDNPARLDESGPAPA